MTIQNPLKIARIVHVLTRDLRAQSVHRVLHALSTQRFLLDVASEIFPLSLSDAAKAGANIITTSIGIE